MTPHFAVAAILFLTGRGFGQPADLSTPKSPATTTAFTPDAEPLIDIPVENPGSVGETIGDQHGMLTHQEGTTDSANLIESLIREATQCILSAAPITETGELVAPSAECLEAVNPTATEDIQISPIPAAEFDDWIGEQTFDLPPEIIAPVVEPEFVHNAPDVSATVPEAQTDEWVIPNDDTAPVTEPQIGEEATLELPPNLESLTLPDLEFSIPEPAAQYTESENATENVVIEPDQRTLDLDPEAESAKPIGSGAEPALEVEIAAPVDNATNAVSTAEVVDGDDAVLIPGTEPRPVDESAASPTLLTEPVDQVFRPIDLIELWNAACSLLCTQ